MANSSLVKIGLSYLYLTSKLVLLAPSLRPLSLDIRAHCLYASYHCETSAVELGCILEDHKCGYVRPLTVNWIDWIQSVVKFAIIPFVASIIGGVGEYVFRRLILPPAV